MATGGFGEGFERWTLARAYDLARFGAGIRKPPKEEPKCAKGGFEQHTSRRLRSRLPGVRCSRRRAWRRFAGGDEIPMRGMANSINVATAAAIVLYSISSRAMSRD
jgi:hypothetical protein